MADETEKLEDVLNKTKTTKTSDDLGFFLRLYVVPIAGFLFFIGTLLFIVLPKISDILSKVDDVAELNNTIERKETELQALQTLRLNEQIINTDLSIINSIAPTGETEVVDFRNRLTDLADSFGLEASDQNFNERPTTNFNTGQGNTDSTLVLQQVETPFEVRGEFTRVLAFIDELELIDDFIVFTEFSFAETGDNGDIWSLELTILKYQFENATEEEITELFQNIPPTAQLDPLVDAYVSNRR